MQTAENRPAERLKYTHGKGYVLYTRKREEKTFFMKKIAICGDFLGKKITGIQRVAYETVSELDKLVAKGSVVLVIPKNVKERPEYENIEVVAIHSDNGNRHFWIQWWFALYIIKNRMTALTFCNEVPILKPGIAYLHDIYYKLYPEIYRTAGEKLTRMFVLMLYRSITRRAKYVITDSETSKKEIIQEYNISKNRIDVIGGGWQHILRIQPDCSVFERTDKIPAGEYYFTLGSITERKNIKWIFQYAKKHRNEIFVCSGKAPRDKLDIPENVKYLGYVSDEQMMALYSDCKAFIFPSLYEGFGLPPLEAMAAGARVIVSNASCLPEIYGHSVCYIDPYNTDVELSELLALQKNNVQFKEDILNRYSWEKSAERLHKIMKMIAEE